jgi:DNA-binding NarL/FixJ family response regulator
VERLRFPLTEDHARVAGELRGLLAAEFDVVATVADGNALLQAVDDYQPDVVVTDIVMPSLLSRELPTRWPATCGDWTTDWYQEHKEIPHRAARTSR